MTVGKDFNRKYTCEKISRNRGRSLVLLAVVMLLGGLIVSLLYSPRSSELEARVAPINDHPKPAEFVGPPPPPEPVKEIQKGHVPSGSSITALLGDYLSPQEIYHLSRQSKDIFPFTRIVAGRPYQIVTLDGKFDSFTYEIDSEEQLLLQRHSDEVQINLQPIEYEVVRDLIQGRIENSLFAAVSHLPDGEELAFVLADIFGWDINFILDIRTGDSFRALVEKRYRDGNFAGYGKVLAAQFINQGQVFNAIRFQDGKHRAGYYNEKGDNLRKAFLKAPLSFRRISSGFNLRRKHPILKYRRSHPAIDYAAPTGTPVKAIGDGTIVTKGYSRGNGNYLKLRHSNGYMSAYLHLNGFARGIARGKRVTQGDVIAYVGSTGLSTGPHLHFAMTRHGQAINPLTLKNPTAKSISQEHRAEFTALAEPLLARLERDADAGTTQVAALQNEPVSSPVLERTDQAN